MPAGRIPGTYGNGANNDELSPAVPFGEPNEPIPGPTSADTNYGRAVATDDRRFPVDKFPGEESPIPGPQFGGTCQNLWGYMGSKK
jgi:hypothetical protein